MQTRSKHILAEFHGCNPSSLNDLAFVEASMQMAAAKANATVVTSSFHKFGPQGVSGVLVLAESHLSVHTWPEHGYAATDIYVCGDTCLPELAQLNLGQAFEATHHELMVIERGLRGPGAGAGMRLVSHSPARPGSSQPSSAKRTDLSA